MAKNNVLTLILVAFWTPLSTKPGLLGNTGDLSSTHITYVNIFCQMSIKFDLLSPLHAVLISSPVKREL